MTLLNRHDEGVAATATITSTIDDNDNNDDDGDNNNKNKEKKPPHFYIGSNIHKYTAPKTNYSEVKFCGELMQTQIG